MKLFALALVATILPAQIRQPASSIRFGSALPSTCTANIGQVFFLTSASAGANLYGCTASNTWTVQGSGVGGGSNLTTVGAVPYVSASGILNQATSLAVSGAGTTAEALTIYNSIASGVTKLTVKAGAGQSSTNLQEWQNNAGTVIGKIDASANIFGNALYLAGGGDFSLASATMSMRSDGVIAISATANATGSKDTSLSRISAGIVGVGEDGGEIVPTGLHDLAVKAVDAPLHAFHATVNGVQGFGTPEFLE